MRTAVGVCVATLAALGTLSCSASNDGGCTKDRDCKGNRVCVNKECVDQTATPPPQAQAPAPAPDPDDGPAEPRQKAKAAPQGPCATPRNVSGHPNECLVASNLRYFDKGIVNQYRQLIQIAVLNKSAFPVQGVSGTVSWSDESGAVAGSVPFSTSGIIPAGGNVTFTKAGGNLTTAVLQTKAKNARISFGHVDVVQ